MTDFCGEEILRKIEQLENELDEVEKEMQGVGENGQQIIQIANQAQMERKLEAELQELNSKNGKLEKELREVNHQIDQIVADYARKLPAANCVGRIHLKSGHKYTPEIDIFLRYGAAHCRRFFIWRDNGDGFVGSSANFFNDLIKHYYRTKAPGKTVSNLVIELPLTKPAPWPAALVQPEAGEMNVEKVNKDEEWVEYILRNKHNPGIEFTLWIQCEGEAKCYEQMTGFVMRRVEDVQSAGGEPRRE